MSNFYKYNQDIKASVCKDDTCIMVYGDTAKAINTIAFTVALVVGVALLSKVLR